MRAELRSFIAGITKVPPMRTSTEWARENRVLPPESAEPGPFRPEKTPYFEEISRAAANPEFSKIIIGMGSQMGKTEFLFNLIGWQFDDDPTPTLFVGSTQKLVESISKSRIMKMFRTSESLWVKLSKGKDNKVAEKFVAGVRLGFAWASSATELASHLCGLVLLDERDRMDSDVKGEGDPVELAEVRISTYPDGKIVITSTYVSLG